MSAIDVDLYQSFTKPLAAGGRLVPMAGGKLHVGVFGSDPTIDENKVAIYFVNQDTGINVELPNPTPLNSAGKPEYQGQVVLIETDSDLYSVAVMNSSNQVPPGYMNKRAGTKKAFDELDAACQEFGLPYSDSGTKVMPLVQGMDITGVIGLISTDGTLWYNSGLSGIVTAINLSSGKFVGSIDVDSVAQMLTKKRDENMYQPDYNYVTGNIVIGSDKNEYYCHISNGPSFGGSVTPVGDTTKSWRKYPYEIITSESGASFVTIKKHYDGTMEITGTGPKNNGLTTPQTYNFPVPFIGKPSMIFTSEDFAGGVEAKLNSYTGIKFLASCVETSSGNLSALARGFSYSAFGRWV